jgi:nitrate/nitrite transport system ATP-binding protein
MSFLELINACKSFGVAPRVTEVLRDVNLSIHEGEFVAIVGYSGSGKSTLMSLLSGLNQPDSGEARFAGKPIDGPDPKRAIIFQNYSLLPWLSVQSNVELAVEQVFPKWSRSQMTDHAMHYIQMVNLAHASHKLPRELSGGMRQRVSVARALAMDPQVLLMDEPLGALDALTRATLQEEIASIWERQRKTALLITNDVAEAILMADRIIPLTPGPGATLGPSFRVDLPRPRDRKTLAQTETYKRLLRDIVCFLRNVQADKAAA